jgi:hypothetical protein
MSKQFCGHVFAGAAICAAVALFGAARPADVAALSSPPPLAAPNVTGAGPLATDDGGVNDNGQTSGDIFTQNAQDQSTADGAGTN